jgi:hypothetical protein
MTMHNSKGNEFDDATVLSNKADVRGLTVHVVAEIVLCTNCARMQRFQQVRVSFERKADSPICCKR